MSIKNFDRQYRLKAGITGKQAFEVGNDLNSFNVALHINFSIEKSDADTANTGSISLWNLNAAQLAILSQKDCEIELLAGYGTKMAKIATGNVTFLSSSSDGADKVTEIEFAESRVELRDTYISLSYAGRLNSKTVWLAVARNLGMATAFSEGAVFPDIKNGFSFVGAARGALDKLGKLCNLKWSIQNGVLQVFKHNEAIRNKAYLLNEDTGLLDVPRQITIASSDENGAEMHGWEITYLLNGAIGINDCVKVESKIISGVYRVMNITMSGDNLAGDWICTAQVVEA